MKTIVPLIVSTLLLQGEPESTQLEQEIGASLDAINSNIGFTLTLVAENGHEFTYSIGDSDLDTHYESASTAKWITSTIIMWLVQSEVLSLDDNPQNYIATWPESGVLSQITLRNLLSFTSGLNVSPTCTYSVNADFESCVAQIAVENINNNVPGETYHYNSAHMQVAGLMAIKALNVDTWQDVFKQFQAEFNVFGNSAYNLPSESNPILAGGMTWTTRDYREFLKKLIALEIVNQNALTEMSSNQTGSINIANSPWSYGLGVWVECPLSQPACNRASRISSPGSYGSYPFIDLHHNYYGLIAMQGPNETINHIYPIFSNIVKKLESWAQENREDEG